MSTSYDKNALKKIAKGIRKASKICFFHHVTPDGDAISSSYALVEGLRKKFPDKTIKWIADEKYLKQRFHFLDIDFSDAIESIDETWTSVVGDTSVRERIYEGDEYMKAGYKYCFDHHTNDINMDVEEFWQESKWGASAMQSYLLAKELEVTFTPRVALLFVFGILTDTGNLMYSLSDPRPAKYIAELFEFMENEHLDKVYRGMKTRGEKEMKLQKFALNSYKIKDGVAWLKITDKDQKVMGLEPLDCKRVNLLANIKGVEAWLFFIEDKSENIIRTEFRSFGTPVNSVAKSFGGGGHIKASGCHLKKDFKEADKVVAETQRAVKEHLESQ